MKRLLSAPGLVQVFIWLTNQLNVREYSAFAIACLFSLAYAANKNTLIHKGSTWFLCLLCLMFYCYIHNVIVE